MASQEAGKVPQFNAEIADRFVVINRREDSTLEFSEFNPENETEVLNQFNKGRGDAPTRESLQEVTKNSVTKIEI